MLTISMSVVSAEKEFLKAKDNKNLFKIKNFQERWDELALFIY